MKFIGQLLDQHIQRYPRMELVDVYKLLHQAAMGPGHAVDDPASARDKLEAEVAQLGEGPDDPIADPISPDGKLARIHLRPYLAAGHSASVLANAFVQTGHSHPPAPERLEKFCACLGDLAAARRHAVPTGRGGELRSSHCRPGIPSRAPLERVSRSISSGLPGGRAGSAYPRCTGSRRVPVDVRDAPDLRDAFDRRKPCATPRVRHSSSQAVC